jgi:hypothetical protein
MVRVSWDDPSQRWLIGLGLVVWGITVAVPGLGLAHTEAGRLVSIYWPTPFMAYGLIGIIERLVRGRQGVFWHLVVLLVAAVLLASHLHVGHFNGWTMFWAVILVAIGGAELLHGENGLRTMGVGDVDALYGCQDRRHVGGRRYLQHMIGDIRLDLSELDIPEGETPLEVSSWIGDITLLVPRHLAVSVVAETTLGDVRVFGETAEGIHPRLTYESPGYPAAPRRLRVHAHLVMGDVTVQPF